MEQKSWFLGMLLCTSGAIVLGNMLADKGVTVTRWGQGVISTGKKEKQNKEISERDKILNVNFFGVQFWNTKIPSKWISCKASTALL